MLKKKILQVSKLNCERNYLKVLRNVSFKIHAGEMLLVKGKNGSGKTSLLLALAGILPFTGNVSFDIGIEKIGYVGHKNALRLNETVEQHVDFWIQLYKSDFQTDELIKKFNLHNIYDLPVHFLSFGQRKKLSFVRLFLLKAKVWLLDEPLTGLDKNNKLFISNMISNQTKNGVGVILTTHEKFFPPKNVKVEELHID
tara:strand:- start:62 stop:655 length:594 start_codon:yes stop_codon:yes gene_type:complete